ncbi:MAG: GH92 family glycosyl hydrolase, partial [Chitinophagales bacterium]
MKQTTILLLHFWAILLLTGCNNSSNPSSRNASSSTYQIPEENLQDYLKYVNPFIGTGGHGHTYPGATAPFGMVQVSPDTRLDGWDGCSAYHHSDSLIYGFSHTHLSGTGVSDYGDVLLMPTVGVVTLNNGANGERGYRSAFSHFREDATAGYYHTYLTSYNIDVRLTAKKRTAHHQYTFPKTADANIIIDLLHRDKVLEASLKVVNDSEIEGYRISDAWAKEQHVYFVIQFSKPFKQFGLALDEVIKIGKKELKGTNVKGYVKFDANVEGEDNEIIMAKVGISAVSIEGARKNLKEEMPLSPRGSSDWVLENSKEKTQAEWLQQLNKIQIEGGTEDQKNIFYTALYHTMIAPNLYTDVDGKYRGMDNQIHTAEGFDRYTVFSLWDTYRAANPLYTLIEPQRTNDFIRTFLSQYQEGGILPIWELASNYTGCMIGYHAIPVIADAYQKGIRDYDVELAFEAMKHSAEQNHLGLEAYKTLGYIPSESESESVSKTLEYAYDDWCIAQMAKDLGKTADYKYFLERSQSYKNVFDPTTQFMRAKLNQTWWQPFEPSEVNFNYTEANAWQYSYYVPQDIAGWIQLLGGKSVLDARLDAIFEAESGTSGREQADITGLIGQYAHGNEPSHHIAYLYNYVGKPWKTQEKVRQIMEEMYQNKPDGLSGNEDCGQMSAWYVWSAMGLYPVTPAQNIYAIGSPLFDKATINLPNGKQFVIEAKNNSRQNKYIQRATFNDQVFSASFVRH